MCDIMKLITNIFQFISPIYKFYLLTGLPPGEYFTLEKVNDTVEHIPIPNGEYMTLAKEDDDENSTEHDRLLQTEMAAIGNGEPEVQTAFSKHCICSMAISILSDPFHIKWVVYVTSTFNFGTYLCIFIYRL
jgi:hypothetical protein